MNNPQPLRWRDSAEGTLPVGFGPLGRASRAAASQAPAATADQRVLLLQGPASALWAELGRAFEAAGTPVLHVRLSLGDWFFRRGVTRALDYRGSLADWENWLERLIQREGITDILYFGDRLPYHVAAQRIAGRRPGLRAWAVEFGYLRPNWLTLEPMAMGRHSRFTRDPDELRALAEGKPPASLRAEYVSPFWREAFNEVVFNLAPVFGRIFYPRYVSDRALAPVREYWAWLPRMLRARPTRHHAKRETRRHIAGPDPFVLIALQLDADYQIRASSDYTSQSEMLEEVIASFGRSAPRDMRLLIKVHPFDPELTDWAALADRIATRHGAAGRVTTIRGGNLSALIEKAHGLVTTNSTTGVTALAAGRPVQVMGDAVYDVQGLTHQGPLDRFWTAPERPDPALFDAWARAAAASIQLRGSLFNPRGRHRAVSEIVRRVGNPGRYWKLWRDIPSGD